MIQDEHELELLISSRFPIIALETQEEARALALLRRCALNLKLPVRTWSVTTGLSADPTSATGVTPQDPAAALRAVASAGAPGLYVWLDIHPFRHAVIEGPERGVEDDEANAVHISNANGAAGRGRQAERCPQCPI